MIILKLKDDTYFTDNLNTNAQGMYEFDTTTKSGKIQHHILGKSAVIEIIEQDGTVEETRKPKVD